jgi:hypothetical protein
MRPNQDLRSSLSPLVRLGVSALVGVVLAGVPTARAFAAEHRDDTSASDDDDSPITTLGEQLVARQRDAGDRLRGLMQAALERTVERVHEARSGMERVLALGYGLEELADAEQVDDAQHDDGATAESKQPRRFEYAEETNDPLAGL